MARPSGTASVMHTSRQIDRLKRQRAAGRMLRRKWPSRPSRPPGVYAGTPRLNSCPPYAHCTMPPDRKLAAPVADSRALHEQEYSLKHIERQSLSPTLLKRMRENVNRGRFVPRPARRRVVPGGPAPPVLPSQSPSTVDNLTMRFRGDRRHFRLRVGRPSSPTPGLPPPRRSRHRMPCRRAFRHD